MEAVNTANQTVVTIFSSPFHCTPLITTLPQATTQSPPFCHGIASLYVPLASFEFGPVETEEM